MSGPLSNHRHEKFVQGLYEGKSQSQAYADAGYNPSTSAAARLYGNVRIQARLAQLQERAAKKIDISHEAIMQEMAKLAMSNPQDFIPLLQSGDLSSIDRDTAAALAGLEFTTAEETDPETGEKRRVLRIGKVKLADKRQALADLAKMTGIYTDAPDLNIPVTFVIERTNKSRKPVTIDQPEQIEDDGNA